MSRRHNSPSSILIFYLYLREITRTLFLLCKAPVYKKQATVSPHIAYMTHTSPKLLIRIKRVSRRFPTSIYRSLCLRGNKSFSGDYISFQRFVVKVCEFRHARVETQDSLQEASCDLTLWFKEHGVWMQR